MMVKHLEAIDHIYNFIQNNCNSETLDMERSNKGKYFLDHNRLITQMILRILGFQQGLI